MTLEELEALFEKHEDEYKNSDLIPAPRDLAAMNKMQLLVPAKGDIVSAAEHDEYWLATDPEEFAAVATEEDVIFLRRCGVLYEEGMGFSFYP